MLKCNRVLIHIVITIGLTSKSLISKSQSELLGWSGSLGMFMSGFGRETQSIYGKQSIEIHSCTHVVNLLFQNWIWPNEILFQGTQVTKSHFILLFLINFYWSMVALLYYVSFHCTAKRISHVCGSLPFRTPFPFSSP